MSTTLMPSAASPGVWPVLPWKYVKYTKDPSVPRPDPGPVPRIKRKIPLTMPSRIPSISAAANLRQNPAASPLIRAYGVVDVGQHRADRAPRRPGGGAGNAHDPAAGGRRNAHPRPRPRQPDVANGDRPRQPRRPAEGLVARRERERGRTDGDQRPLVGAHPDRHEHRPQASPAADEARCRAERG